MDMELKSFLGTGWSFPPAFNNARFNVKMVADEQDIAESIRILLGTTPGERIMQPEYGCNLRKLVFEKVDALLVAELNHLVYHALLEFEPRVDFTGTEIIRRDELDGILHISVEYRIIITNTRHNIVFPFYLLQGTNIADT